MRDCDIIAAGKKNIKEKTIFSADSQCSVDDALDLVHDVVLCEQMVEISVGRQAREVDGCSAEEAEYCVGGRGGGRGARETPC